MAPLKCCVGGCDATSATHRLYSLPKNNQLRNLWMSFLVPTNSMLLGLSTDQLINRRVCEKHFDRQQFDQQGRRLRNSYPCLFTQEEIARGEPLATPGNEISEHNYFKIQDDDDVDETMLEISTSVVNEHDYCKKHIEEDDASKTVLVKMTVMESPKVKVLTPRDSNTAPQHIPTIAPSTSHQNKSPVKEFSYKKMGTKHRQFVKKVKKITTKSVGLTGSKRIAQAQTCANDQKLFGNFQHLSKEAKKFLIIQLRECRKNKMARRFTLDEKLMALLLMKQSPKEYKLLQNMFALPSKRTLNRIAEKISIKPGLNLQIFSYIETQTKNWEAKQKLCTIVFDEVALTPHLTYDEKHDQILGFVDIAEKRQLKFCDHALVFMLRGVCSSWRQTVAYYFCEGTVSAPALQNVLKQLVVQVAQTGLTPLGLVCDQGSTFRAAIKKMREDTLRLRNMRGLSDDGSINIAGYDLSIFFDLPHLLKGLRNNFLNKYIIWNGRIASWKDIQFIYDLDSQLGHTRALPKLTENHVNPDKIKKMKVSIASQVFSARTAAMLKYTINALNTFHNANPGSMETTAEVIEFFDSLFDSVNGYAGGAQKGKLRKAVKPNSEHIAFWMEAIKKLKQIKFKDCDSKVAVQTGRARLVRVPSQEGWITTLESFLRLTKLLFQKYNVDYYYPRNINQDPLENFFGRIRALNYRNINPDANTFVNTYKSLLLTNILSPHSKFANCEVDNGESIIDVGFLFEEKSINKENEPPNIGSPLSCLQENPPLLSGSVTKHDAITEKIKVQCSAYTAGYICRKVTKKLKCKNCLGTYTSTSSSAKGLYSYIKHREYKNLKNDNLVYPIARVIRLYRDLSDHVHFYLDKNCHNYLIFKNLTKIINRKFHLSWLGCANHSDLIKALFVKYIIKLQVHNWCNRINKILKGGIERKYLPILQNVPKMALKRYETYIKRKRSLNK